MHAGARWPPQLANQSSDGRATGGMTSTNWSGAWRTGLASRFGAPDAAPSSRASQRGCACAILCCPTHVGKGRPVRHRRCSSRSVASATPRRAQRAFPSPCPSGPSARRVARWSFRGGTRCC
eukprot:736383-Prymnesium_polylepis.1